MQVPDSFKKLVRVVANDPSLLLYTVDLIPDKANFLPVNEDTYRQSMFLDNRVAVKDPQWVVAPLWQTIEHVNKDLAAQQCNFIFHVGHCGSTICTRLLESFPNQLALREPLPLRALAAARRDLGQAGSYVDPGKYAELRKFIYGMISRRFTSTQNVVVKATSDVCNVAGELLDMHKDNRALLMFLPLENFLTVMLRNAARREETAHFAATRIRDLLENDVEISPLYKLNDAERAALSWLSNMFWLTGLANQRAQLIDFEALLQNPATELSSICKFLDVQHDDGRVQSVVNGPVLSAYSKDPKSPYNPASRQAELAEARRQFDTEIRAAMNWAADICSRNSRIEYLSEFFSGN